MFKSKAQKEAEHRLKVEQEMERIRQKKEAARQRQEMAIERGRQQGEAIKAWVNASPDNRNLILTGIAGLFTGGIAGAIVSPIVFHQYSKRINNSAMKWLAWAGTGLIAAPILISAQAAMFGGGTEPQSINAKNEVTQVEEVQPVAAAPKATPMPTAEATPIAESKNTSVGATVTKTGLDFSYEAPGRVVEREGAIVVTYYQSEPCDNSRQFKQTWETTFNLQTQRWSDRVQQLSNCLVDGDGQWIEYSADGGDFAVSTENNRTVIRANALETDGSLIVPNALVVEYEQ